MPQNAMTPFTKVLIANRGEIAVRIIRAARDSGKSSVAVYADQDRDALHARLADESYALDGQTSADTYLSIDKILSVARRSGADAVHPGYGFLAENADFARAVIGAGLVWIGPSPDAIESLGDKVTARHVAEKVGAPLAPGTPGPVDDADAVLAFAQEFGLPIAIKAAYGGGGRGLKVARTMEEIPELFESATREAISAFGRGECFVEKYLDKPRHVETQCLADAEGNVVVVSTRDCSLQRRHQKLVGGPRAVPDRRAEPHPLRRLEGHSARGRVRRCGNVRVPHRRGRHDLVPRGQHAPPGRAPRLRGGHRHRPRAGAVPHRGGRHARGRRPRAGRPLDRVPHQRRGPRSRVPPGSRPDPRLQDLRGPGIRLDSGVTAGDSVSGAFDSLLAKIIVTGRDRAEALERARRALDEFEVAGLPTVLPFHRKVVRDPAFTAEDGVFGVFTRWIETEFVNDIPPWDGEAEAPTPAPARHTVVVEVAGKRLEVSLPDRIVAGPTTIGRPAAVPPSRRSHAPSVTAGATGDAVKAPMQATIVKVAVEEGQQVVKGDLVVVLEAMKMEQPLQAHKDGTVGSINAEAGTTVSAGHQLLTIS